MPLSNGCCEDVRETPIGTIKEIPKSTKESRERLVEMINVANECLELAERKGIKDNEKCRFGEICQLLWRNF